MFLLLFLGISILSVFPCHGGLQPPFINTVNAIYNRCILNNIESRVSIGVNKTYVFSLTEESFVSESRHLRHYFHNCDITLLIRAANDTEERQRWIDVLYFFRVETEELDLNPPLVT